MENVPVKLNNPINEFHFFEDNQVLTADQLNRVIQYLDRQHRLTRTKLMGTGIVCGLEIRYINQTSISISKGAALTTDGDLLHLHTATNYTQFKPYDDKKARYAPFWPNENANSIDLFRLYAEDITDAEVDNLIPLENFNEGSRSLDNMVVVLYLNSFLEPPEDCTELDCDNAGPKQRAELIPLLIAQADLENIGLKSQDAFFKLPNIDMERVVLSNDRDEDTDNIPGAAITQRRHLFERFQTAVNNSKDNLVDALVKSCGENEGGYLQDLIRPLYNNANPAEKWKQTLDKHLTIDTNSTNTQYVYDFMKDLAEAYGEFKETIYDLYVECCPNPQSFAKHIMLGSLAGPATVYLPDNYRHYFCEAPILNQKDRRVQKAMMLHKRIDLMILAFNIPRFSSSRDIDITPSVHKNKTLSEKAIPFYYNTRLFPLAPYWNFEKNIRGQAAYTFSYHNRNDQNAIDAAKSPFRYCTTKYDHYRIEGHLGQELDNVEARLDLLKQRYNIGFKVEHIMISSDHRRVKLRPKYRFPGLNNLTFHYREEMFDNINLVRDFNKELETSAIDDNDFTDEPTLKNNLLTAKSKAVQMNSELEKVNISLFAKTETLETNFVKFETAYTSALSLGHEINENVFNSTQTKHTLPHQDFVVNNKLNRYKRFFDFRKKKKEKLQEQFLFQKFYEKNVGLEHLAGVPEGGTFVLVYEEVNNQNIVVADFALPYCCTFEEDPEVEITPPVQDDIKPPIKFIPPTAPPFRWIDKLDIFKIPKLNTRFTEVKSFATAFQTQSNDFYKTVIPSILTAKVDRGSITLPDNGGVLDPGFIDDRFGTLFTERFGDIESGIDERFTSLDNKFTNQGRGFDERFGSHQREINKIPGLQSQITTNRRETDKIPGLQTSVNRNSTQVNRIGAIESRVNTQQTQINKIDGLEASVRNINTEISDVDWSKVGRIGGGGTVIGRGGTGGNIPPVVIGRFGPAISPTTKALVGNIKSSNLQTLAANVVSLSDSVKTVQNKKRPSKADKEQLVALEQTLDTAILGLLSNIKGLKKDVKVTSDQANAINMLIEELNSFKTKAKLTTSKKALTALKKQHQKRSVLSGLLKKVKI